MWSAWWVWIVAGFAIGMVEIAVPGYIFLGFAIGAILTGTLIWLGFASASLPVLLLIFAIASLAAWVALKSIFGLKTATAKQWNTDINEN